MTQDAKAEVREFWQEAACGEKLLLEAPSREGFARQAAERYRLEPQIPEFARFDDWKDRRVLEIGVGLGADHQRFLAAGARLTGVDLTPRAIEMTRRRLDAFGLRSDLRVGDAEDLELPDDEFDLVFSWGVIHHSPRPEKAVAEIYRVLKPGGTMRVMIYSKWSLVGLMLWLRYGLLRLRPFTPLRQIYANHLESPGTKAYSVREARRLFSRFEGISIRTSLTHGDLLTSGAGQRHGGMLLTLARRLWPRWLLSRLFPGRGLFMMIEARKPAG